MNRKGKRLLALVLALFFCAQLSAAAFADAGEGGSIALVEESSEIKDSGSCGANMSWTLTEDGWLHISGSGEMQNYNNVGPWTEAHSREITGVELEEGITGIGNNAFCCCQVLCQVKLPDSLKRIGLFGFRECPALETVTLPEQLRTLADGAFKQCRGLKSITIPARVTTLGPECFQGCDSLKEIRFLGSAPTIGTAAFQGVTATAYYPANDPSWSDAVRLDYDGTITWTAVNTDAVASGQCGDGLDWSLSWDGVLSISGSGDMWDYTASKAPVWLSTYADTVRKVVIGEGVTGIGNCAFFTGPHTLKPETVQLPESLIRIGKYAFSHSYFGALTLPTSLQEIGEGAFEACGITGELRIPGTVRRIGKNAFFENAVLERLILENGVQEICEEAFSICENLQYVSIPGSVTAIGSRAFGWNNYKLTDIDYAGTMAEWKQIVAENAVMVWVTTVHCTDGTILPRPTDHCGENLLWTLDEDGVLTVSGSGDMWDFDSEDAPWVSEKTAIQEVIIQAGASSIGNLAFAGCYNLTRATIAEGVTRIGRNAFSGCRRMKDIVLPESTVSIGVYAFGGSGLTSINIPENVTSLGESAFSTCNSLEVVWIPGSLKYIGQYAFSYDEALKSVNIGEGVSVIGGSAFYRCIGLSEVRLPNTVTKVEDLAFCYCSGVTRICFSGKAPEIGEHSFGDVKAEAWFPANDPSWTEDVRQNYSGTLSWGTFVLGDANGDGKANVLDLVWIRNHLAGNQVQIEEVCADVNGDGVITPRDLIRLRKLLVGMAA